MSENLTITRERVDDIPLLWAQLERRQEAALLDEPFPTQGNWPGLSLGTVASVGLTCLRSEANPRLSQVAPWGAQRLPSLAGGVGQPVRALDFSDERLAAVLAYLSAEEPGEGVEHALNAQTLRGYALQPQRVRIDRTTAKSYGTVIPEGVWQLGHSKAPRPELPQGKSTRAVVAPLGRPLTTTVVVGEHAEEPLSVPAIHRVQASRGCRGGTSGGDGQRAALQSRAPVAARGDD